MNFILQCALVAATIIVVFAAALMCIAPALWAMTWLRKYVLLPWFQWWMP